LVNDIDVAAMEARIAEHRAANAALIEMNEQREAREAASLRDIEERERLDRQQRAEEARRAEEEEERERERSKLELINQLVGPCVANVSVFRCLIEVFRSRATHPHRGYWPKQRLNNANVKQCVMLGRLYRRRRLCYGRKRPRALRLL
jgi:hypothetical protein